jgi:hypothetical protein
VNGAWRTAYRQNFMYVFAPPSRFLCLKLHPQAVFYVSNCTTLGSSRSKIFLSDVHFFPLPNEKIAFTPLQKLQT